MTKGSDDLSKLTQTIVKIIGERENRTKSMSSPCIFRVPEELRKVKKSAYTPQLVSIGPLHSNKKHLKSPMGDIKKQYAAILFQRVKNANKTVDIISVPHKCVEKMKQSLDRAKECFAEKVDALDVTMLVVDGCFILELLYRCRHTYKQGYSDDNDKTPYHCYDGCIPFFLRKNPHHTDMIETSNNRNSNKKTAQDFCFNSLTYIAIRHDLLLLENQLPFFVLEDLFELTVANIPNHLPSLGHYLLSYFGNMMNPSEQSDKNDWEQSDKNIHWEPKICEESSHILHFLYNQYGHPQKQQGGQEQDSPKTNSLPPASELDYAGVKFEVSTKTSDKDASVVKVQFDDAPQFDAPQGLFRWCHRASFKIPTLRISASTERLLRNLIAFEQCYTALDCNTKYDSEQRYTALDCNTNHDRVGFYFTSYATLMDRLVDTMNDVQVLETAGVIYSRLGDREEATHLFNSLCKEIVLPPNKFHFAQICNQAASYSKRCWPKYSGYLWRTYFTNPWTFIAFLVAFIAFGISVTQFIRSFLG